MRDQDDDLSPPHHIHPYCRPFFIIQEWTGTAWVIVDDSQSRGRAARPLDPTTNPGRYVGERVRTPCD